MFGYFVDVFKMQDESAFVKDPAIVSYRRSADLSNIAGVAIEASVEHRNGSSIKVSQSASAITHSSNAFNISHRHPRRETGVIEKLLVSQTKLLVILEKLALKVFYL